MVQRQATYLYHPHHTFTDISYISTPDTPSVVDTTELSRAAHRPERTKDTRTAAWIGKMAARQERKAAAPSSTSLTASLNFSVILGLACTADALSLAPPLRRMSASRAPRIAAGVTRSTARSSQPSLRWTAMSAGLPGERRDFLKNGLAFLFSSAAVATSAVSPALSDEELELDDESKEKIVQALKEALQSMGELEVDAARREDDRAGSRKDVLNASSDVLPNRTPFEMQYELFKRGMELEDEDNFVGAEKQWTEIIENFNSPNFRATSPGNKFLLARAYSNRGNTRLSLQKTREAILDYSESIDLMPEKGEFWLARGVAYEDMADRKLMAQDRNMAVARTFYESALADYDHAVVLDPQDPRVYISRGDANTLLGQEREALDNYVRAVNLSPMTPEFRSKVALAFLGVGNREKGAYLVGQLLQRYPNFPEMLLAGAAVAWEEGNLVESQEMYSEAIRLDQRLMDEKFIWLILRWPERPLSMVKALRAASSAPKGSGLDALGLKTLRNIPREVI